MKKLLIVFFIFLSLLPVASAADITSIFICHRTVYAEVGQRLTVPCTFHVDVPIEKPTIDMEWCIVKGDNSYQPILHLRNTKSLTGDGQNGRIKPKWEEINQGDCSLIINSIHQGDSGIYIMRLSVNGGQYQHSPKIKVYVRKSQQINKESSGEPCLPEESGRSTKDNFNVLPKKSSAKESGHSTKDNSNMLPKKSDRANEDDDDDDDDNNSVRANQQNDPIFDNDSLESARILKAMKDNGSLLTIAILVGFILLVIPLTYCIATFFWLRYRQLNRKSKDSFLLMEEGFGPKTQKEGFLPPRCLSTSSSSLI